MTVYCTVWYTFADLAWYTINNFDIQMDLNEDGSMQIEESIEVNFSEARHGIYRDIPLGMSWDYLTIENITSNNNINTISNKNDLLSIQLWDPDTTVTGTKIYTISYTIQNAIKTFTWWDELSWNIIWWQWDTTINRTTWTLNLPKEYKQYTGSTFAVWWYHGDQYTWNIEFLQTKPTQWRGILNTILQPKQGITIWIQFQSGYFILPAQYDDYFITTDNSLYPEQSNSLLSQIWNTIRNLIPYLSRILIGSSFVVSQKINSPRKSKKPITTQYNPPKNIDTPDAFYLWYNNKAESKIFTSLVYHRATHGWIKIQKEKTEGIVSRLWVKDKYSLKETFLRPEGTSETDDILLQKFFGPYDNVLDNINLSENSYTKIKDVMSSLQNHFNSKNYTQKKQWLWWLLWARELTPEWSEIFEYLRGYKEFLSKVEQPVIEQELKSDPDFVNKIIPRSILFGVETRLLSMVQDIIKKAERYQSSDGSYLTAGTIAGMNKTFAQYSAAPRSSGASSFGGSGGFSWWGRWGWGWGSR